MVAPPHRLLQWGAAPHQGLPVGGNRDPSSLHHVPRGGTYLAHTFAQPAVSCPTPPFGFCCSWRHPLINHIDRNPVSGSASEAAPGQSSSHPLRGPPAPTLLLVHCAALGNFVDLSGHLRNTVWQESEPILGGADPGQAPGVGSDRYEL